MNNLFLNNIKEDLIIILKEKSLSPVDMDSLSINYRTNLDEQMEKHLKLLREQGELLSIAKNESNETLALSALLKLRTHAMSLSSFFDGIVEDTETIIRLDTWPEITEE